VARKGEKVDQEVKRMIEEINVTIPIIWIKQNLFLVGNKIINLEKRESMSLERSEEVTKSLMSTFKKIIRSSKKIL
jgi:hypothetical protein